MGTAKWISDTPASASALHRHSTKPLRADVMSQSSACSVSVLLICREAVFLSVLHSTELGAGHKDQN